MRDAKAPFSGSGVEPGLGTRNWWIFRRMFNTGQTGTGDSVWMGDGEIAPSSFLSAGRPKSRILTPARLEFLIFGAAVGPSTRSEDFALEASHDLSQPMIAASDDDHGMVKPASAVYQERETVSRSLAEPAL